MKIEILCPQCSLVLKDKFECPRVRIDVGEYLFKLECYKCERYFDVNVAVQIEIEE